MLQLGYVLVEHWALVFSVYYPVMEVTGRLADLGAGIASISFVGAGVGQGIAAAHAVDALARNPEMEGKIRNFFILGAAIAESGAIYGLVIAMILLFVTV